MLLRFLFCILLGGCLCAPERSKRSLKGTKTIHMKISPDNKLIKYPYAIDYPYMIELLTTGGHLCGGALVRPNFALTARHCFPKNISDFKDVSRYKLLAGNQIYEDRTSSFVQVRQVEKIVINPNVSKNRYYDLAVVKVIRPFDLNIHVNVIKIPSQSYKNLYIGKRTVNLGWGGTETGFHPEYLLKVYGYIVKCSETALICINGMFGGFVQGGDSGGPSVIQGKERKDDLLVGIIYAIGGKPRWYVVNLAFFADWINETIAIM